VPLFIVEINHFGAGATIPGGGAFVESDAVYSALLSIF